MFKLNLVIYTNIYAIYLKLLLKQFLNKSFLASLYSFTCYVETTLLIVMLCAIWYYL